MLVILSEINCLERLNQRGIIPDEFYTDFDLFRNKAVFFEDVSVVIVLIGVCNFNRRMVMELVSSLRKRCDIDKGSTIKDVIVLSDTSIVGLKEYYKFEYNLDHIKCVQNGKALRGFSDIISELKSLSGTKTEVFLSDFDNGVVKDSDFRYKDAQEKEYIRLIKRPIVRELF